MKEKSNCPFCGSEEISLSNSIQNNYDKTVHFFIECIKCAALGPESDSIYGAWDLWNKRATGIGAQLTPTTGSQPAKSRLCPVCNATGTGNGFFNDETCTLCNGTGKV